MKGTFAQRLMTGLFTAALMVLWTALVVSLDPQAQGIYAQMPRLVITLGLAFAGIAFLIGAAPSRSDL